MRVESILLKNYRQFKNVEILFNKKHDNDMHIIIGKNGTGKTNILNAINWCLYGDEPHLAKDSQRLPILNLSSIQKANDGEDKEVAVEIHVRTENNRNIIFTRKDVYRIYKNENNLKRQNTDFEVTVDDEKGNNEIFNDDEADLYVERFVPRAIRKFFFFDGERLDSYFREASSEHIRHSIFIISQIDLLENKIEHRVNDILKEFRRKAGRANPKIKETVNLLEEKKSKLESVEEQIEKCGEEILTAKVGIRECGEKLTRTPDLENLEKERLQLKSSKKHNKNIWKEKVKEKQDLLFESGKIIMLWPTIKTSIKTIEEKRKSKEIPPSIESSLLKKVLEDKICNICGRKLNDDSEKHVINLLRKIKLSSNIARQLHDMGIPLHLFREKTKQFEEKIKVITHEVENYEKELEKIEKKMNQIDKKLIGYNAEKIKEWVEQRKKYEEQLDKNQRYLGRLEGKKNDLEEKIYNLEKRFEDETKKEKKVSNLKKQINFCNISLDIIKKTKEIIMNEIREQIEAETKYIFLQLVWKKKTFKDISISENYDINLIHSMGYDCLGSVGAAERELLALSFTLALHRITGFDSPILIDTPVARISDVHRENFGKVFSKICNNKQIILLFTPDEYSKDISRILDVESSNRFNLKLLSDENETKLEVL